MEKIILNDKEYELIKDYKNGYDKEEVANKFTDYFDNFDYVCGDWAYGKLRLKGFYDHKNKQVKEYNDYLQNTLNEEYIPDIYLDREHLYSTWDKGYIYIITKKSTGEFYVGQTNIVPIFRWGQHLKTARFPIENLVDYKFEVLEEVSDKHLLLNREAYWINKMHDQNPELCLNKNLPKFEQK